MNERGLKIKRAIVFAASLCAACFLGFAASLIFKIVVASERSGMPTELCYGEEAFLSEYEKYLNADPEADLEWSLSEDGVLEFYGEGEERGLRAVGAGTVQATVSQQVEELGEKRIVATFEIHAGFREPAVDGAARAFLKKDAGVNLTKEALETVSSLDLTGAEFTSLGDLRYFTGLREVDFTDSNISAVTPALFCEGAAIERLCLAGCKQLKDISALYDGALPIAEANLYGSGVEKVDFARLSPTIKKLNIGNTEITALTVTSGVAELYAEQLSLTADLLLSGDQTLQTLSLSGSRFPSLTLEGEFGALTDLDIHGIVSAGAITLRADFPVLATLNMQSVSAGDALTLGGTFGALNEIALSGSAGKALSVTASLPQTAAFSLGALTVQGGATFSPDAPVLSRLDWQNVSVAENFTLRGEYARLNAVRLGGLSVGGRLTLAGSYASAGSLSLDGLRAGNVLISAELPAETITAAGLVSEGDVRFTGCADVLSFDCSNAQIAGTLSIDGAPLLIDLRMRGTALGTLSLSGSYAALGELKAENAHIGTLAIASAAFPGLTALSFTGAGIASVSLSYDNMPRLTEIRLGSNALRAFPLPEGGLAGLTVLDLSENALEAFELRGGYPVLRELFLDGDPISAFQLADGFGTLETLSMGSAALTSFSMRGDFPALTSLDFSQADGAEIELKGTFNVLRDIDLGTSLSSFTLDGNFPFMTELAAGSAHEGSVLKELTLNGSFERLATLALGEAGLTRFTVSGSTEFPALKNLSLGGATFPDFSLPGTYPVLTGIDLDRLSTTAGGIRLEGDYPALTRLNAPNMRVGGVVSVSCTSAEYNGIFTGLQGTQTASASLEFGENNNIRSLSLDGAQLSSLRASSLGKLNSLEAPSADIGTAELSALSALQNCNFTSASFRTLRLTGDFDMLANLNFTGASVGSLTFGGSFRTLPILRLSNAALETLNLGTTAFPSLTQLYLDGNNLTRLTFEAEMPSLNTLSLTWNRLESLTFSADMPALTALEVASNGAATLDLTLGGDMPMLSRLDIGSTRFGRLELNGAFPSLSALSLQGVTFREVRFGEHCELTSAFHVDLNEVESYVYGNLPMPAPFLFARAGNAEELKSVTENAAENTVVYAAFGENFGGAELVVSPDAPAFGIYGTGTYEAMSLRSSTNDRAQLYFYNVSVNADGNILDVRGSASAELYFYGICTFGRSGVSASPAATVLGARLSVYAYGQLIVRGQNAANATSSGGTGYAGGSAVSASTLTFGGTGNVRLYGGNGGDGMQGADEQSNKAPETGGAGGAGGIAVTADSLTVESGAWEFYGGMGGAGATGGAGKSGTNGANSSNNNGGAGGNGNAGATGGMGGAGGAGLRAGTVELHVLTRFFGGKGGAAGRGGNGGRGGDGGDGGSSDVVGFTPGYGWNGGNAGNGGNGGNAGSVGRGGNPYEGFTPADMSFVTQTAGASGASAAGGKGGSGGYGGERGERHTWFETKYGSHGSGGHGGTGGKSSSGKSGDPGASNSGRNGGVGGDGAVDK